MARILKMIFYWMVKYTEYLLFGYTVGMRIEKTFLESNLATY